MPDFMQNNKAKQKCMRWQLLAIKYLFMANLRAPEGRICMYLFQQTGISPAVIIKGSLYIISNR